MGTSERWNLPHVLDFLAAEQPRSLIDIGAGWGKFGVLAREYASPTRVDGMDVQPPRHPGYDHFYVGDVRDLDRVLPADAPCYDLALFIEVLEHLDKNEGWEVLAAMTRRAKKVLVTTPLGFRAQDTPELPYEIHRSGWFPWEFRRRFRVHALRVYPTVRSRWLGLPRHWQILAVLSARDRDRPAPR